MSKTKELKNKTNEAIQTEKECLKPTPAQYLNASSVFDEVETDRMTNKLSAKKIVTSDEWFDLSSEHPGYLMKTSSNGEKQIGKLENGKFKVKTEEI